MDLDRLALRLRPRTDWEAIDLGFALIRTWWRPVYAAWLSVALPVAAILTLLFGGWGFLIFWWLLPLFEATTLTVISRTIFGDVPPLGQVLRQAPQEWKRFLPEATWRRLDLKRSFHLPVSSLEHSEGHERRARIQVLGFRAGDAPSWLTFAFFFFAFGLATAFVAALVFLTPPWLGIDWNLIDQQMDAGEAPWAWKGLFFIWALMILLVDPIYTAAGFCLYLNRRTALEGWDLEIAFRSMSRRIRRLDSRQRGPGSNLVALAPWLLSFLAFAALSLAAESSSAQDSSALDSSGSTSALESQEGSPPAGSQEPPGQAAEKKSKPSSEAQKVLAEIMTREELTTRVEVEEWELRSDIDWFDGLESGEESSSRPISTPLAGLVGLVAQLFEIFLWLSLVVLVALIFREIWRGAPKLKTGRLEVAVNAPVKIAGLDVRRESLPADVAATAAELWRSGKRLEALSLLYRGALSRLHEEGVELRESFTEADCLVVARRHLTSERSHFFSSLTQTWQSAAYAHRLPADGTAEGLISGWRQSFALASVGGRVDAAANHGERQP